MKRLKTKWIILGTVAGLIGTTSAVGAEELWQKVTGVLHPEVKVLVNGQGTGLTPVYIDGTAYIPVRAASAELGYEVVYDEANKEIELSKQDEAVDYMRGTGVIVNAEQTKDGQYRLELLGKGSNAWVILYADQKTVITDAAGNAVPASALKAGTQIEVQYGPVMAMSFPGQSHAAKIIVGAERLIKEDVIQSVKQTDDGWQVQFGETRDVAAVTTLTLNAGKETSVLTAQGESVAWDELKVGMKVRAYYGPIMTKSLPPQSPLFYLVVLGDQGPAAGKMTPEAAQEYRDLAWAQVKEQASHITTKPEEAVVQIVSAQDSGVLATTDEQKKLLEELKASNRPIVTVTYNTDQDTLLGPLTVAYDLGTKTFLGYYARR